MSKNDAVMYGLTVTLNAKDANALTTHAVGDSAAQKLSTVASGLLADLARGGVMVPPDYAERVQTAIGTTDHIAITEAVERSVGKRGDAVIVPWVVDPTQVSFYKYQAENAGITLAHQLKAHLDYAYANGWLGSSAQDVFKILLTPEQYRWMQERFGEDVVTGKDVIDALQASAPAPVEFGAEEVDDLVLGSMREGK